MGPMRISENHMTTSNAPESNHAESNAPAPLASGPANDRARGLTDGTQEIVAATDGNRPGGGRSGGTSGGFGGGLEGGGSGGNGGSGSGGGDDGGFRGRRVTTCSFCGKTSREVGPMVEGPNDIYICANCTDLCQNIFRQERRRVSTARPPLLLDSLASSAQGIP